VYDVPAGENQDFMTRMVVSDSDVWGRPAAVEVAQDGALPVVDDGAACPGAAVESSC
jgi:hypothetical protein